MTSTATFQAASDRFFAAMHEHRLEEAMVLGDTLIAESRGEALVWRLIHRAALAHHMGEFRVGRGLLGRALGEIRALKVKHVSPHTFRQLAYQCEIHGMSAEALEMLLVTEPSMGAEPAWRSTRRRLSWGVATQARLAGLRCSVVPIGQECLPFDLAMRWGFGEFVADGPFTAGVFYGDGPAKAVQENFARFLDPTAFKHGKTPSGVQAATLPAYNSYLNHQLGEYWLADGAARVIALYKRRIANFDAATGAGPVLFLLDRRYPTDMPLLLQALEAHAEDRFRLLILDSGPPPEEGAYDDPRVIALSVERPGGDYVWFQPDSYNSEIGMAHELPMAEALADAVEAAGRS